MRITCPAAILGLLLIGQARAQSPEVVPSTSIATEGGPGMLWVNPSHMAFDPEARWGVFTRYAHDSPEPLALTVTGGISIFGAGVRWIQRDDGLSDFSLDTAIAIPLPKRLAAGIGLHWLLERDGRNALTWDASMSWRPLPWIGFGAVTRNIGAPGGPLVPTTRLGWQPMTGFGVALRPAGDAALIGADLMHTFGGEAPRTAVGLAGRFRPTPGLFIRARLDSRLAFGAGVEMYFGGAGVGTHAGTDTWQGVPTFTAWASSESPKEHLAPSRRQVSSLRLDSPPPYRPEATVLGPRDNSWLDTLEHLNEARRDPRVRGLVLSLGSLDLPPARWEELRREVQALRAEGRDVVAYLAEPATWGAVHVATAASRVLLHPTAVLDVTGPSADLVHLGDLMRRLGVGLQVVRRSEHKTLAEPWIASEPSDEELTQRRALLDGMFERLLSSLSQDRGVSRDVARAWIDQGPWTASEAVQLGIADALAYPDQIDAHLAELHGDRFRLVNIGTRPNPRSPWDPPARIAMVYLEGPILPGDAPSADSIGLPATRSRAVLRQLADAARDPRVRAVVLRIDSPGGAQSASDALWRGVQRVRSAGKPVVVSLGGVAASGGYYVASAADAIWAEPSTVTGSIGVITLHPHIGGLLEELGVNTTRIAPGRNAGLRSVLHPWDPVQQARMDALVDESYRMFKARVAAGRGMTADDVEALAGGRVWSGADALDLGLVDALGSLTDAIADARKRAGIPPRRPVEAVGIERPRPLLERLFPNRRLFPVPSGAALAQATLGAPISRPLAWWWIVSEHDQEHLWMIDPTWMEVR